ncbi:hypothetical protein EVAR_34650_1 [Eumeta japonica]|uniref:Uncharacterized protein n=1 Tax=Eumeta variegata TaxID=151549 RepID=A0A4C1VG67_EUMVA|nr:hypothetical protein EVAR_34650_1 [Eumeta japonica]
MCALFESVSLGKKKGEKATFVFTKTIERKTIQPGVVGCANAEPGAGKRQSILGDAKAESVFEPQETRSGRISKAATEADLGATAGEARRTSYVRKRKQLDFLWACYFMNLEKIHFFYNEFAQRLRDHNIQRIGVNAGAPPLNPWLQEEDLDFFDHNSKTEKHEKQYDTTILRTKCVTNYEDKRHPYHIHKVQSLTSSDFEKRMDYFY